MEYAIPAPEMEHLLKKQKIKIPFGLLDRNYYYTNLIGWLQILGELSSLPALCVQDKFDCDNVALRAMNKCAEVHGMNTLGMVVGKTPHGLHCFNIFYCDEGFKLFEPNPGYGIATPFEIGENGYYPQKILM